MANPTYLYLGQGSVDNDSISTTANIDTGKLKHRYNVPYGQTGTVSSGGAIVHTCYGTTGTIKSVGASLGTVCASGATVEIDVELNGVSILSSALELNDTDTNYVRKSGSLSTTAMTAGQRLEVVITATAGGGTVGSDLAVNIVVDETN